MSSKEPIKPLDLSKPPAQLFAQIEDSIRTLGDGKLDKRDPVALVTLLGALAGLGLALVTALQAAGVL